MDMEDDTFLMETDKLTRENGQVDVRRVGRHINGEQLAELLEEAVNTGVNGVDIEDNIGGMHRYLQSELFKNVAKPIIIGLAAQNTDARNEQAVRDAQEMCEALGWEYDEVPFPK